MKEKERAQLGLKSCKWRCATSVRYAARLWTDHPGCAR